MSYSRRMATTMLYSLSHLDRPPNTPHKPHDRTHSKHHQYPRERPEGLSVPPEIRLHARAPIGTENGHAPPYCL